MINIEHKNRTNSAKQYGRKTNITNDNNGNWGYKTQIKNSSNELVSNIGRLKNAYKVYFHERKISLIVDIII